MGKGNELAEWAGVGLAPGPWGKGAGIIVMVFLQHTNIQSRVSRSFLPLGP